MDAITEALVERNINPPVLSVDVRRKDDVLLLVEALLCQIEVNELGLAEA